MGAGAIGPLQDRGEEHAQDHRLAGRRVQEGKGQTPIDLVTHSPCSNKMTEQYDATEIELKKKVDEKRK
jgi:hypothetical protein